MLMDLGAHGGLASGESDQDKRARAELDKGDVGPIRVRPGFRRASLVAGRTPERLARAGIVR